MPALIALFVAFVLPFVLIRNRVRPLFSWFVSCLVVPAFVLVVEFVLPYTGGGASMWPIALVFGALYSAVASGVGTLIAAKVVKPMQSRT
jgi:hypothetical protein